jgi:hypothetical protein
MKGDRGPRLYWIALIAIRSAPIDKRMSSRESPLAASLHLDM